MDDTEVLYHMTSLDARYRNYATVLYPESADPDWREIITQEHVPLFVSPLHDQDVDPLGKPKKSHYHVMVMFEGKKSDRQVRDFFERFGGVGCEVVQSIRGYARYLCHLDNPEKHQYDVNAVTCYAGADYMGTIGLPIDRLKTIRDMQEFCIKYRVRSFYLLCNYAMDNKPDWFRCLTESCAYYMSKWLQSSKWTEDVGDRHIFDPQTGELIY